MTWIDITQPLYNGMPVWPGDTPFSFQLTQKITDNGVNVGKVCCSTHAGTHVDAPYHYDDNGCTVHELDLELYIGQAQVIHLPGREVIQAIDIETAGIKRVQRLLIRTDSVRNGLAFPDKYTYIHPDVAPVLDRRGVKLLGVDVPSVDFVDSKTLEGHHGLHRYGIHILENLALQDVEEGIYHLVALPLPIQGADGCPVRAVLKRLREIPKAF